MNHTFGITPNEVLAICRLRQWSADRVSLRGGRTTDYQRQGYTPRNNRAADAKLVRVIDFERAMSRLSDQEQAILILTYAEKQTRQDTARALHCSTRCADYNLKTARRRFASILDRLDLL